MKIGQKLKSECFACGKDEIWEIESIEENVEYLDGKFRMYNLKAIENCLSNTVKTSIKDSPDIWQHYKIINL